MNGKVVLLIAAPLMVILLAISYGIKWMFQRRVVVLGQETNVGTPQISFSCRFQPFGHRCVESSFATMEPEWSEARWCF